MWVYTNPATVSYVKNTLGTLTTPASLGVPDSVHLERVVRMRRVRFFPRRDDEIRSELDSRAGHDGSTGDKWIGDSLSQAEIACGASAINCC